MKKVEKYIILILSIITVAAIGTAVYFGINSTEKKNDNDKVIDVNKEDVNNPDYDEEQEDNKEAIAFCEANKDVIYKNIIENRNNSLAAKYDKKLLDDLYKISSKNDLNCNYASGDYSMILYYTDPLKSLSDYIIFDKDLLVNEYVANIHEDLELNEFFASQIASKIIENEREKIEEDMYYINVLNYYNDDVKVLLEIVNGDMNDSNEPFTKLLGLYLVDLKTKTYEKLK